MKYDYLVVGSGLYGATFAFEATKRNKTCLVVEKRSHIGGNIYCTNQEGIHVHQYGAHIFHTNMKYIWDYICQFTDFNHYINCPLANYQGEIYNLPFNMNTFNKMWGVIYPQEAREKIEKQCSTITHEPKNLEEQAISLVGKDIYEKLIKGYTEKQWGRNCSELPAFIIRRIPVRYTYNNNYFNDPYQGIPINGYNDIIEKMLVKCDVQLNTDFNKNKDELLKIADKIIYTGPLDTFYNYCYGALEYRSLRFETQRLEMENYQGVAVMNFTDFHTPYTRMIEHKHFEFGTQPVTYITKEYPQEWKEGCEPYYPINDEKNQNMFEKYSQRANQERNIYFGGRLAEYKYYDMDKTIASALQLVKNEF
jgi:UDP-galactopyranose mutase